jgi:hypothetical protein
MLGTWDVKVSVGSMPEKIATALANFKIVGAEYTPIAYLGSQVVNGVNHAVLAEQLLTTGKDVKNVVVMIFNEKGMDVSLVNIERVVESGGESGGIVVDVKTDIPEEAKQNLDTVLDGFVGSKVEAFALLGTQVVKGINYIYAVELTPVTEHPTKKVALAIANSLTGELSFTDLLGSKCDSLQLGYAFTWLKRQNTSLGAPLGEWP